MCLYLKSAAENPRGSVTKEAITVYKKVKPYSVRTKIRHYPYLGRRRVFKRAAPLYHNNSYIYKIGELCPVVEINIEWGMVDEGYHSYFKSGKYYEHNATNAIFEIPKGTKYHKGQNGDLVSETIIFKGWE